MRCTLNPATAGYVSSTVATLIAAVRIVERAAVAHLSAGFGVERRLIQDHLGRRVRPDAMDRFLIHKQADHPGLRLRVFVAQNLVAPCARNSS